MKVYYIHQLPELAWKFTKDRELIEHRAIDKNAFIEAYLRLQENLEILRSKYKDVTISLIIKDSNNREGRHIEDVKDLLNELPPFLTETQLRSVLV